MTPGSVPRRRPRPDPSASGDASAYASDLGSGLPRPGLGRAGSGLGRLQAGQARAPRPVPPAERGSWPHPRAFYSRRRGGPRPEGPRAPIDAHRCHPSVPTPAWPPRERRLPKAGRRGWRPSRANREPGVPRVPGAPRVGAPRALPKFAGRCPSRSPSPGRAGGAVIDRPNYGVIPTLGRGR